MDNFSEKNSGFPWQKFFLYGLLAAALYVFFTLVQDLVTPTIISVFLAFVLNPAVDFFERKGLSRIFAAVLLYIVLVACLFVLGFLLKNVLATQVQHLKDNLPSYKKKAHELSDDMQKRIAAYQKSFGISPQTEKKKSSANPQQQGETMSRVFKAASSQLINVVSFLPNLFLIPLMTFFFLKDGRAMKKLLISFVPNKYFELALTLLYEVNNQIGMYIRGQLMDSCCVAVLFSTGLAILHVPYFFILGPFAGISNIIPYVGPMMGFSSSALVVLLTQNVFSLTPILHIALLTMTVQMIDSILIGPLVVGKSVDMHPLVIVFALLAGGKAMGLMGMLIAVPVASSIKVIFYTTRERVKDFQIT